MTDIETELTTPQASSHQRRGNEVPDLMQKTKELAHRRGFIFQSAAIYGGFRSAYDYGPLGVELTRNVKQQWWREMVQLRDEVVGLDASILSPPAVWEASGHLANFSDPLVECSNCHERHREDTLDDQDLCPSCGQRGTLGDARQFNLMFKTYAGPVEGRGAEVYLRPETAQGQFQNFKNILESSRKKPPFGIAQIGRSFRNEITPGHWVFRTREFEQMELEYFVRPEDAVDHHAYWMRERMSWYVDLGIPASSLRLRAHEADELSHYSAGTSDVEFDFPWGWGELEGIANRGDYDLTQHANASGVRLEVFDPATGEHYVPHVIEPAAGATRAAMAFLLSAYTEEEINGDVRTVLRLDPRLAPVKVAVLPLQRKGEVVETARRVLRLLQPHVQTDYDQTQAIGRRYRRQDEIGTPLCVTIDPETVVDGCVTVRHRDTMAQRRVSIDSLVAEVVSSLASDFGAQ